MADSVWVWSLKCVASRCNGLGLNIQRLDQEVRLKPWKQQMHYASVWILSWHCNSDRTFWSGTQQTWTWWEIELLPVGRYGSSNNDNHYSHLQRIQRYFDWVNDNLTRHSYIAKLKIASSWYRTKSKSTTAVKNTASYIPWLYTTWSKIIASIHCFLVLMPTTIKQAFCIKFKQCLFIILKLNTHIKEKTNLLLWRLWRAVQKVQELYGYMFP